MAQMTYIEKDYFERLFDITAKCFWPVDYGTINP